MRRAAAALTALFALFSAIADAANVQAPAVSGQIAQRSPTADSESTKAERFVKLEKKLHGTWYGPACGGDYTFRADGTFELKHFTPGGNTLTGDWSLRWDALPPTLVILCKTSDLEKYEYLNKPLEVKLLELDGDRIALRMLDKSIWRYSSQRETGGSVERVK
jgi:hypothetical protein